MLIILLFGAFGFVKVSANSTFNESQLKAISQVPVLISNQKPTFLFSSLQSGEGNLKYSPKPMDDEDNCFSSNVGEMVYWIVDLQGKFKISQVTLSSSKKKLVSVIIELLTVCEEVTHTCGKINEIDNSFKVSCDNKVAEKVRIKGTQPLRMNFGVEVYGVLIPEIITTTQKPTLATTVAPAPKIMPAAAVAARVEAPSNMNNDKYGTCRKVEADTIVDLGGTFFVDNVVVRNGDNCMMDYMSDAAVELYTVCGRWDSVCGKLGERSQAYNVSCGHKLGTKIRVTLAKDQYMKICNIDVYGEKIKAF